MTSYKNKTSKMIPKNLVRRMFRSGGFDIVGFDPRFNSEARKLHLLNMYRDCPLLDIGANTGQFAEWVRSTGFQSGIHSFEPGGVSFQELENKTLKYENWNAYKLALGSQTAKGSLNVSADSYSSSLRTPTDTNLAAHAGVKTTTEERIQISTLDSFINSRLPKEPKLIVKIDTQGYEAEVLAGGEVTLERTVLLIIEFSLKELYLGQILFHELLPRLQCLGFFPTILEPADEDYDSLEILQIDGWFLKEVPEKH